MATGKRIPNVALVAEADADGTYGAAEADLVNELKAQLNDLLTKLANSGLMER
jgi:hypothetical protein